MRRHILLVVLAAAAVSGCASGGGYVPRVPAVALRAMQTRSYDDVPADRALRAVVQGLQDAGLQVKDADAELGLVMASADRSEGREASPVVRAIFWYPYLIPFRRYLPKMTRTVVDVTASVTRVDGQTRVRVSAQRSLLNGQGALRESGPVEDSRFYQEIFALLDKAMFLEREQL